MSGHCRAYLSQNTYGIYLLHFKDRRYYIFSNTNIVTFVCIVCLFPDFLFKKAGILSVSHVGKMDMVKQLIS